MHCFPVHELGVHKHPENGTKADFLGRICKTLHKAYFPNSSLILHSDLVTVGDGVVQLTCQRSGISKLT